MVITGTTLEELKAEYEKYKDTPEATFVFHGETLLVGYAKYLIEFLGSGFDEIRR